MVDSTYHIDFVDIEKYKKVLTDPICMEVLAEFGIYGPNIKETTIPKKNKLEGKDILICSGGGIKGLALMGVLKALNEFKYLDNFTTFAGASVGSLIIALHVVGYTPDEMCDFIRKFDLDQMKHINIMHILSKLGLDDRNKLCYVVEKLIMAKGIDPNITLFNLNKKTGKKITFTTVCVNTRNIEYLSHDNYPNLPFIKSIMMSLSIPLYYTPIEHNGKLYIDGGCIDNYPINLYKNSLDRVLGIYLTEESDEIENITDIETYLIRVLGCFTKGVDFNATKGFELNTIIVKLESINIIDYGLDLNKKEELFKCGYDTIVKNMNESN